MANLPEESEQSNTAAVDAEKAEKEFREAAVEFKVAEASGDKAELEAAKVEVGHAFAEFLEAKKDNGVAPLLGLEQQDAS